MKLRDKLYAIYEFVGDPQIAIGIIPLSLVFGMLVGTLVTKIMGWQ
jgi:hypothetical protein